MKVFNLRCQFGHDFEGWFASSEDFDCQRQNRLLVCPLCESANVERLPSAPRLNLGTSQPDIDPTSASTSAVSKPGNFPVDDLRWMQTVRELTEKVLNNTENVGDRFAEEARRIHYQEVPERAIRGTATAQQRQELQEEGVPILSLPMLPAFKDTLQ